MARERATDRIHDIAHSILDGFNRHYRLFREVSAGAKDRFDRGDWAAVREATRSRIGMYDRRVIESVMLLDERFPTLGADEALWPQVKIAYIHLLYGHRQPECAETFFNSVACRVLHRRYYRNEYLFWRPSVSTEHLDGDPPAYQSYYPQAEGVTHSLAQALRGFGLQSPFQDLQRDLAHAARVIAEQFPEPWMLQANFQLQVLASLFFRNRAAYAVGRAVNGGQEIPFVIPIVKEADGSLRLDALLIGAETVGWIFSTARAYFMVDMDVPAATVRFLKSLMPSRPTAELYTLVGLQKQGKTLFYRDLHEHLQHSSDSFVIAPGTRGMVMVVFTLPSFPYVFKVIRDWFDAPKDTDRAKVSERYLFVKEHDRVGRMADTLEYSHVAFPASRFDPALLAELARLAPQGVERDGDQLVIHHLYVERSMIPLDVYLRTADEAHLRGAVREFGTCIKDLAAANLFPGDLMTKNFGVTRYGRVVFYDYDELCEVTDCNFRSLPAASTDDEETAGEPWFYVGPHDVFPEQFATFLFAPGPARELFLELHKELLDPAFWSAHKAAATEAFPADVRPYPDSLRFRVRFGEGNSGGSPQ